MQSSLSVKRTITDPRVAGSIPRFSDISDVSLTFSQL